MNKCHRASTYASDQHQLVADAEQRVGVFVEVVVDALLIVGQRPDDEERLEGHTTTTTTTTLVRALELTLRQLSHTQKCKTWRSVSAATVCSNGTSAKYSATTQPPFLAFSIKRNSTPTHAIKQST